MRYIYFYPTYFQKKKEEFKTAANAFILSLFSHQKFIKCDFTKCKLELPVEVEWDSQLITDIVKEP